MIAGIEHVTIAAKNTRALANWYWLVLGFSKVLEADAEPQKIYFVIGSKGSALEIIPASERDRFERAPNDPGICHIALAVSDFEGVYEDLKKKGVAFTGEPKELPNGVKFVFFTDPEGNLLHLVYRPRPL